MKMYGHKKMIQGRKGSLKFKIVFAKKSLTNDGKDLQACIAEKVISQKIKLRLISNFYTDVLPLFNSMVLVFEQKEGQLHKFHNRMVMALRSFIGNFMKHEAIVSRSPKCLKTINIEHNVRADIKTFFVGNKKMHL